MAARGSQAKAEVSKKILEAFPGSFLFNDGKEIRINTTEEGLPIQIKVTLTAAKVMVGNIAKEEDDDVLIFDDAHTSTSTSTKEQVPQEPSAEEKERLTKLLGELGLA